MYVVYTNWGTDQWFDWLSELKVSKKHNEMLKKMQENDNSWIMCVCVYMSTRVCEEVNRNCD